MKAVGKHLLVDFIACNGELLKKVDFIDKIMFEAAKIAKATIVGKFFKQFEPYGVSGVIVIAESHFTMHTWPEHNLASVDFFSCTDEVDMQGAITYLKEKLEAKEHISTEISRGNMKIISIYNNKINENLNNEILL
jgi:S-adenosylmethionine decarboxylase